MDRIAIIDGIRTPFCKMGTAFNDLSAQELGRIAARELLERTRIDPAQLDEVIFGCVGQPAEAANIARVIGLLAGVPKHVPAYTVHRNCASGMESVDQAIMKIRSGRGDLFLVGGAESMSNIPFYYRKNVQELFMELGRAKSIGAKLQVFFKLKFKDLLSPRIGLQLGLTDPVCGLIMGLTAEELVKEYGITRREQDEFALESHVRALNARETLREEIMPVIPGKKFKEAVVDDNGPREGQSIEALEKLRPYFDRHSGTVTVGNSSQVTDGAVALLVTTESKAKELGYEPIGYVKESVFVGVEPAKMGIGPAHAIPQVLKKAQMKVSDIDSFEINEAFAAQVLACLYAMDSSEFAKKNGYEGYTGKIDPAKLNCYGGAIALGHPVGSTGARLVLSMLKQLQRKQATTGIVSLCVGGGQGAAMILERT